MTRPQLNRDGPVSVAQIDQDAAFRHAIRSAHPHMREEIKPADPNDTRVLRIRFATGYVPSASSLST